tara:strand:- start:195 stop:599 length:405 start_codon:yes stop_codon:yes gene_type:complete
MSALTHRDFVSALAEILQTRTGMQPGEDLFAHRMLSDVRRGVLILQPLVGVKHDHYLPGYRKGRYAVVVRESKQDEGLQLARTVEQGLTVSNVAVAGFHINHIRSVHEPVPFPMSESGLIEFSLHFDCNYVDPQ